MGTEFFKITNIFFASDIMIFNELNYLSVLLHVCLTYDGKVVNQLKLLGLK